MEPTESEQHDLRMALTAIYGPQNVDKWKMKYEMLEVLAGLVSKSRDCSKLIDMVPRPAGWMPGVSYIRRQLREMARRALTHRGVYELCANTSALALRSRFSTIGQGG